MAFAFLAASYRPPTLQFNIEDALAMSKKSFGYEIFGYWKFFSEGELEYIWKVQIVSVVDGFNN